MLKTLLFPERTWRYRDVDVLYRSDLDGGGRDMSYFFIEALRQQYPRLGGHKFRNIFEWCCGPGFIGYALLAEGLCERLCLADINPLAIDYAKKTAEKNHLTDRVDMFVSDNFKQIPSDMKFDLIVSNSPNYYGINPQHPYYSRLGKDLRPNDQGWAIHKDFYATVSSRLLPGGTLMIQEISPHQSEVWTPEFDVPYDIRPRPPIVDFQRMIESAGLIYEGTSPLCTMPGGFYSELVRSRLTA